MAKKIETKTSGTVNRGWLKRRIQDGSIEAKCDYHYTDDYAFDNANKFGKTDWLPVVVRECGSEWQYGKINFFSDQFSSHYSGRAYWQEDETIVLSFGFEAFTLRVKEDARA